MSSGLKVVPWADWNEWAELRSRIAARDHEAVSATLALYRLRRPASLPLAVQATAELAVLLDFGGAPLEPHARRLALAMALVRLVNGATDSIQPRADGATARSVHSLAKVLRMPPILVELRHQAAHNALPRLDALVDAGHEAMAWLEAEYWRPQEEAVAEHLTKPDNGATRGAAAAGPDWLPQSRTWSDPVMQADDTGEPLLPSAHGSGPTKRRPCVRWQTSGSPSDWKGLPIGLLPGQIDMPSLIGIDVGPIIGRTWQPPILDESLQGVVDEDKQGGGDYDEREGGDMVYSVESDLRPEACNRELEDEVGDFRPARKVRRSLSDAEKSKVQEVMQQLLASSGAR